MSDKPERLVLTKSGYVLEFDERIHSVDQPNVYTSTDQTAEMQAAIVELRKALGEAHEHIMRTNGKRFNWTVSDSLANCTTTQQAFEALNNTKKWSRDE